MPRLFLSYATKDRNFVEKHILDPLATYGVDVWYDQARLNGGNPVRETLLAGLESSDFYVLVMSRSSWESDWVAFELRWALIKRRQQIIPVRIDDWDSNYFPGYVSGIRCIDFVPNPVQGQVELLRAISSNDDRLQSLLRQGRMMYQAQQFEQAEAHFSDALNVDPQSASALVWRARCRLKQQQLSEATIDVANAIRLRPDNSDAVLLRGELAYMQNDFDVAIECYDSVLASDNRNARALNDRACAKLKAQRLKEALDDLKKAVELAPRDPKFWSNLGQMEADAGNWKDAEKAFLKAIRLSDQGPHARFMLAYVRHLQGDLDKAIGDYERAVVGGGDEPRLYTAYGYALFASGKLDAADGAFDRAVRCAETRWPRSPERKAHGLLGKSRVALQRKQWPAALALADDVIRLDRGDKRAWVLRGEALHGLGKYVEAVSALERAGQLGECARAYELLGNVHEAIEEHDLARERRKAAWALRNNSSVSSFLVGLAGKLMPFAVGANELRPADYIQADSTNICQLRGLRCSGRCCV